MVNDSGLIDDWWVDESKISNSGLVRDDDES